MRIVAATEGNICSLLYSSLYISSGNQVVAFTYKHDIVGILVHRNDNIFVMKRGKTLNSFLVFKYRLRSIINTIFEFVKVA
jgi:hypothetical protein